MGIATLSIAGVMAGANMYSTSQQAKANNKAQARTQEEAERRYRLQASIAGEQIKEQDMIAMEQMTEVSQEFLMAKSKALATQAESGVAGNTKSRTMQILSTKESEAKGKVAQSIDVNKINIARDMLANKIDTESIIRESKARELSSSQILTNMLMSGVQGGAQGYMLGSSLSNSFGSASTATSGVNTSLTTGSTAGVTGSGSAPMSMNPDIAKIFG